MLDLCSLFRKETYRWDHDRTTEQCKDPKYSYICFVAYDQHMAESFKI
jgi:hypothetical protein